jgi:hypothetical protein
MLVVGMFLFWNRGGDDNALTNAPPTTQSTPQGQGSEGQPSPTAGAAPEVTVGVVPDVVDANVLVALDALTRAELPYLVIETANSEVPEETVFEQSPSPGTTADDGTVVTLVVSR